MDCILLTIYPNTYSPGSPGQNISRLRDIIKGAINMQPNPQRHNAVIRSIRRPGCIPCRISLHIIEGQPITINRIAKICFSVKIIAQILHDSQFHFHEPSIIAVVAMTHHPGSLQM